MSDVETPYRGLVYQKYGPWEIQQSLTNLADSAALIFLEQWAHLAIGVTGSGTSADPYTGTALDALVNNAVAGATINFAGGAVFRFTTLPTAGNDNITLRGMGRGTVLQSAVSSANKPVLQVQKAGFEQKIFGVTVKDMTIDGRGVTKRGIHGVNLFSCTFENLEFINAVDYAFSCTRMICCTLQDWTIWASRMTTPTTNGLLLGEVDGSTTTDSAVTCSPVINVYVNGLSGIGLEWRDGFSLQVIGGAFEVCGTSLKTSSTTSLGVFDTVDFESATLHGGDIQLGGTRHSFRGGNYHLTDFKIQSGGSANHYFEEMVIDATLSNDNTATSVFENCTLPNSSFWAGTHPENIRAKGDAGLSVIRHFGGQDEKISMDFPFTIWCPDNGTYWGFNFMQANDPTFGIRWGFEFSTGDLVFQRVVSGTGTEFMRWSRANGKVSFAAGFGVGNSASATTPGSVVKKIQVFDTAGNSLGYLPVYSSIT